jgi:hypothetical protein
MSVRPATALPSLGVGQVSGAPAGEERLDVVYDHGAVVAAEPPRSTPAARELGVQVLTSGRAR